MQTLLYPFSLSPEMMPSNRGVSYRTFLELAKYYKWKSLSLWIRITDKKRFFENSTSLTLHRGSENLKIPIIGSNFQIRPVSYHFLDVLFKKLFVIQLLSYSARAIETILNLRILMRDDKSVMPKKSEKNFKSCYSS